MPAIFFCDGLQLFRTADPNDGGAFEYPDIGPVRAASWGELGLEGYDDALRKGRLWTDRTGLDFVAQVVAPERLVVLERLARSAAAVRDYYRRSLGDGSAAPDDGRWEDFCHALQQVEATA